MDALQEQLSTSPQRRSELAVRGVSSRSTRTWSLALTAPSDPLSQTGRWRFGLAGPSDAGVVRHRRPEPTLALVRPCSASRSWLETRRRTATTSPSPRSRSTPGSSTLEWPGSFGENRHVLSLLVHGNDHVREELNRPRSDPEALALLAQALQRVAALETRAGVGVSRVMVAPHGLCTEQMMRAMLRYWLRGPLLFVAGAAFCRAARLPIGGRQTFGSAASRCFLACS